MSMPANSPQQPPYGGPGFVPPPPQKKQNPVLVGCLGCGGLLVVLIVLGAIVSAVSGNESTTANPPTASPSQPANSAGPSTRSTKTHTPTPPPPPKPRTVLTERGNGMKTTRTFKVHGDWDLYYSFNCANFGGQGNFMVGNDETGEMYVNALAASGKDVTHQHNGDGSTALNINSECNWRIKVVQLP
jgi:hypothetical protein